MNIFRLAVVLALTVPVAQQAQAQPGADTEAYIAQMQAEQEAQNRPVMKAMDECIGMLGSDEELAKNSSLKDIRTCMESKGAPLYSSPMTPGPGEYDTEHMPPYESFGMQHVEYFINSLDMERMGVENNVGTQVMEEFETESPSPVTTNKAKTESKPQSPGGTTVKPIFLKK